MTDTGCADSCRTHSVMPPAPIHAADPELRRSVYQAPGMDCPSEERLIRLALDGLESVVALDFDLAERRLTIWHRGEAEAVTGRLAPLGLGARLIETTPPPEGLPALGVATTAQDQTRALQLVLAINALMFIVELTTGWLAESTGLIADSLDMLADATVYGLSLYAVGRGVRQQLRAAHVNGWLQLMLGVGVLADVLRRLLFGSEPEAPLMVGVSLLALGANVACLTLLHHHRNSGAHMRAGWICSTTDVLANGGVILAGALVAWTGSSLPDLLAGSIIAGIVIAGGWRILRLR